MIVKQMDVRANIKKYFDIAYEGEPVIVPRKENKNVVIISEEEYNRLGLLQRSSAYAKGIFSRKELSEIDPFPPADVKTDNLNRLVMIERLKENWNGNGAPAFDNALIVKVRSILESLTIQPEIFPTALMTIQLEYDNSRRDHMEIEIGLSDTAEIFLVNYNGLESFEDIPATASAINKRIYAFYG